MFRRVAGAVAAVLALGVLTACDDHKGEHCTSEQTTIIPMTQYVGKVPVTTYMPYTYCAHWAPDDPATVKPR